MMVRSGNEGFGLAFLRFFRGSELRNEMSTSLLGEAVTSLGYWGREDGRPAVGW
jgi:hypothetical protein